MKLFSPAFIFLLLSSLSIQVKATTVAVSGKTYFHSDQLKSARIEASVDGEILAFTFANLEGDYALTFKMNQDVVLTFSKAGFASKKVLLDYDPDQRPSNKKYAYKGLDVRLFKAYEHIDMSLLEQPVAKLQYVAASDQFAFDLAYNQRMQNSLEKLRTLVQKVENSDMASYRQYVEMGDMAAENEQWEKAKHFYHKAMDKNPDQVEDLNRLIADLNAKSWHARQANKITPSKEVGERIYVAVSGKTYPPGMTEEVEQFNNKIVTKRIIVADNNATVYQRVDHNWGGTFYFKDSEAITRRMWDSDTVGRR